MDVASLLFATFFIYLNCPFQQQRHDRWNYRLSTCCRWCHDVPLDIFREVAKLKDIYCLPTVSLPLLSSSKCQCCVRVDSLNRHLFLSEEKY